MDYPDPNPSGLCMCGCGQTTSIVDVTRHRKRESRGHHRRYVLGHGNRKRPHATNPNPSGLCLCGCGQSTEIAKVTDYRTHAVAGFPLKWVWGHWGRKSGVEYIEQDCGYDTPCWVWQLAFDTKGYGQIRVDGRLRRAPRVYYARAKGEIGEGLHVDHLCRNPACVNPDHLEVVTPAENSHRGIASILNTSQVREIRRRLSEGETCVAIAADYGVSKHAVQDIKRNRSWRGVA